MSRTPAGAADRFMGRWIAANAWAEAAGLGTTFVLGRTLAPWLERMDTAATALGGAVVAVLLGALLEGVLVGAAQEGVLRPRLPGMRRRDWVRASAVGAGAAWILGMIPSTVMALQPSDAAAGTPVEPSGLVQLLLAAALGLVTGPVLGSAQWTVLRRHVPRAGRWLWANALAWAAGMPVIFAGMDLVPWSASPLVVALALYAVCGTAGAIVGAIHGWLLTGMLARGVA